MIWLRPITLLFCLAFASSSWAISVLSSIKPIQMITFELVEGIGNSDVLLDSNTSPHDYALRPSDIKKIGNADLIVWFGDGLEPFLSKIISQSAQDKIITVSQLKNIPLRHFDDTHHDDGHDHGNDDPHFWLGIEASKVVAQQIAQRLIAIDSVHANQYQVNLAKYITKLEQTDSQIAERLTPYLSFPYYVFHDAYGYFEQHYQLNKLGYFTVSPERKPGAKTLIMIKKALAEHEQICVFAEPQFKPAVIESVTRGTNARIGILDPLGTDIKVGSGSYFAFLHGLADSFESCFKNE